MDKDLRELKIQFQYLQIQFDKESEKNKKFASTISQLKQDKEKHLRELGRAKRGLAIAQVDIQGVENEMAELKTYVCKLEKALMKKGGDPKVIKTKVGNTQEEVTRETKVEEILRGDIKELELVREANNEELIRLEKAVLGLEKNQEKMQVTLDETERERREILDCLD